MNKIIIKYHNLKMLMTLDLNMLIQVLLKEYGENIIIEFILMNDQERKESSDVVEFDIISVKERIWIFESFENKKERRKDLEVEIAKKGIK